LHSGESIDGDVELKKHKQHQLEYFYNIFWQKMLMLNVEKCINTFNSILQRERERGREGARGIYIIMATKKSQ